MDSPRLRKRERWERQKIFGDVPNPRIFPLGSTFGGPAEFASAPKLPKTPEEFKAAYGKPIGGLFKLETEEIDMQAALKETNPESRKWNFKIVWMSPNQALKKRHKDDVVSTWIGKISEKKWLSNASRERITKMIEDTRKKSFHGFPIVMLIRNKDGTLWDFSEGRHRLMVARELGLKRVPILEATAGKGLPPKVYY